jgi:ribosomal protein L9
MTGAEMMRNYLILKNNRQEKKIDIDRQLDRREEPESSPPAKEREDAARRLEEIRKKREATITR